MYKVVSIRNIISIDKVISIGVWVVDRCFCRDWLVYVMVNLGGSCCVSFFIFVMVLLLVMLGVVLLEMCIVGKFW